MKEGCGRKGLAQFADQAVGIARLGRPDGIGIPFGRVKIAIGDEGWLAARRQADIMRDQIRIDLFAKIEQGLPARLGEGLGDPHRLGDARDRHFEMEIDLGGLGHTADRGGGAVMGGGGERNMALARKQARGWVKPNPAGARQIDFGPCVQVRKVSLGALGAIQRLDIGLHLDEVARDKPRRIAQLAQDLNLQPSAVAARACAKAQRLFGRLYARLHADDIADPRDQRLIERHEKINRAPLPIGKLGDQIVKQRPVHFRAEIGRQIAL